MRLSRNSSLAKDAAIPEHPSATDLVNMGASAAEASAAGSQSSSISNPTLENSWPQDSAATLQDAVRIGSVAGSAAIAAQPVPELLPSASPVLNGHGKESGSPQQADGDLRTPSARSETNSERESTWLSRVTAKTEDLRSLFGLSEQENVMDDFLCALQKRLLLQGRVYVFEHYVCFHSNVFGYVKNKVIPLREVVAVRKRKNLGFPNSIEIVWGPDRRREFFTSFLSREDAFRLILAAWHQSNPSAAAAQMFSAAAAHKAAHAGPKHSKSATPLDFSSALSSGQDDSSANGSTADGTDANFLRRSAHQLLRPMVGRRASERPFREEVPRPSGASMPAERTDDWQESMPSEEDERNQDDVDNDSDDGDADEESIKDFWAPAHAPPPPLAQGMQRLVIGEIRGITMAGFCSMFLADGSKFFIDFHKQRGDENAKISPWRNHHPLGRVRELQFITPLKSKIGPAKTMCYQTQRYAMFAGDQLVFETSQVMPDIPYGDCFTVEARWDVHPVPGLEGSAPALGITTHVMVDFAKSTIWRKAIESGVVASCRASHEEWIAAAQRAVKEETPAASPRNSVSGSPTGSAASLGRLPNGVRPSLAAPAGSPAHVAAVLQLLPEEHREAVGQLLQSSRDGDAPADPPPNARRRLSGRARAAGRLLTKRQWVLLGLGAAVVLLQVIILWRLSSIFGGSPSSPPAAKQPPPLQQSTGDGFDMLPDAGSSSGVAGAQMEAEAWAARLRLLQTEAGNMQRRLELLGADIASALAAAPQQMQQAASSCLGGACAAAADPVNS